MHDQSGSAMVTALCVMMVTVILGLSLLQLSAGSLNNEKRIYAREQCRISAFSVSDVLVREIERFRYGDTFSGEEDRYDTMPDVEEAWNASGYRRLIEPEKQLRDRLQEMKIRAWHRMSGSRAGEQAVAGVVEEHVYHLKPDESVLPGDTVVRLYWDFEPAGAGSGDYAAADGIAGIEILRLYVEVTSTVSGESSTITSVLQPVVEEAAVDTEDMEDTEDTVWEDDSRTEESEKARISWRWHYLGQKSDKEGF